MLLKVTTPHHGDATVEAAPYGDSGAFVLYREDLRGWTLIYHRRTGLHVNGYKTKREARRAVKWLESTAPAGAWDKDDAGEIVNALPDGFYRRFRNTNFTKAVPVYVEPVASTVRPQYRRGL